MGIPNWSFSTGGYIYATPAIDANGVIYFGSYDNNLYAVNPDGTQKWKFPTNGYVYGGEAIGSNGTIYAGTMGGRIYAIGPDGSQQWVFSEQTTFESAPVIGSDGTIYIGSTLSAFYAFNPDASLKWTFQASGNIEGAAAIGSNGTVYFGAGDHNLYAVGNNIPVTGLSIAPATVVGGANATGTVTISTPAPAGGDTVALSSNSPVAGVQQFVSVPAGATSTTFTIFTNALATTTTATITATSGPASKTATLTVSAPVIASLTLNPTSIGGNQTSTGTVTLSGPAPTGGWVVTLKDEYPNSVTIPASVTVAAGATTATFTLTPKQFSNTFICGVYSSDAHSGKNANLTVVGDYLSGLSLNPSTIGGAETSTATVTLIAPAPPGGWLVKITDQYSGSVTVPPSITVPAGASSATFIISSHQFLGTCVCGIYVADNVTGKQANLTVEGDSLSSLTLNPTTIGGSGTST